MSSRVLFTLIFNAPCPSLRHVVRKLATYRG